MRKNIYAAMILLLLFLCLMSSCGQRSTDFLEYQKHGLKIDGTLSSNENSFDITLSLDPPKEDLDRCGEMTVNSPDGIAGLTIKFSDEGTYVTYNDVNIPLERGAILTVNILSALFSLDQSHISDIRTVKDENGTVNIITVKNDTLSTLIYIDCESTLPDKFEFTSDGITFEFLIEKFEFTD